MTVVGFVVHGGRPAAVRAATDLVARVRHDGVRTRSLDEESLGADETTGAEAFPQGLDLIVSVGGDGTFLRAAHQAVRVDRPVLGVNVGRMGFLTATEHAGAEDVIRRAIDGTAPVEERIAVVAEPEKGTEWTEPQWGLNEVMVEKRARHRVVRLAVLINDEYVTTFSGDGVIVATPTGSTAYSFSARGPIVSPSVACLVVTPIAAHMVFDRSFVIGPEERVTIEVRSEEPGLLASDGLEAFNLPVGSRVTVRIADRPARLIRAPEGESFYRRIRDRFGLPAGDGPTADFGPGVPPSG
jgi:NAD+ kinase